MDYKKKIIELLRRKRIMTKHIQFSDLFVAFWELNKATKGGGLLPYC